MSFLSRYRNEIGLLIASLVVLAFTAFFSDVYSDSRKATANIEEILRRTAVLGIFALGAGTVIIAGGIDLSSGSVIAFAAATFAAVCHALAPIDEYGSPATDALGNGTLAVAVLATLAVSLAIGTFHAWLITGVRLPPFVATLASLVGLRSLARVAIKQVDAAVTGRADGKSQIYVNDPEFTAWGTTWWIPLVTFLFLAAALLLLLRFTVAGRHIYAVGGNEDAARLSGIRVERVKWLAYCIGSVTAGIAGIFYCSYVQGATPSTQGLGYELVAITAAVVGGCSLAGGAGGVVGIALGALFLQLVMDTVAKTVGVSPDEFEGAVIGVLVVLAVAFNQLRGLHGRTQFFRGPLGIAGLLLLSVVLGSLGGLLATGSKGASGLVIAVVTFLCGAGWAWWERRRESS